MRRLTLAAASAALLLGLVGPPAARAASAGDPDPVFSPFTTSFGAAAVDVASAPDGGAYVLTADWRVAKLGPAGALDTAWGDGGIVDIAWSQTTGASRALAVDGAGRIVVGGRQDLLPALARLHADGSDDETFGTDGRAIVDFGATGLREIHRIAFDAGGRIVVYGRGELGGDVSAVFLARLHDDGTMDAAFRGGWVALQIGTQNVPGGLAVDDLGRIWISGYRSGNVGFVARYTELGFPDGSWTPGGWTEPPVLEEADAARYRDLVVRDDYGVVLIGEGERDGQTDGLLVAMDPDGALDDGFGDDVLHTSEGGDGLRWIVGESDDVLYRALAVDRGDLVVAGLTTPVAAAAHGELRRIDMQTGLGASDLGLAPLPGVTGAPAIALDTRGVLYAGAANGPLAGIAAGRLLLGPVDDPPPPPPPPPPPGSAGGGSASGAANDPPPSDPFPQPPPIVVPDNGAIVVSPHDPVTPRASATLDPDARHRRPASSLTGRATGPAGVKRVEIAILRRAGSRCVRLLTTHGRLSAPSSCQRRTWLRASGTYRFRIRFAKRLATGRYVAYARAWDDAGPGAVTRVSFTVKRR
jgi:uncharacterized delta-60 repeat protein